MSADLQHDSSKHSPIFILLKTTSLPALTLVILNTRFFSFSKQMKTQVSTLTYNIEGHFRYLGWSLVKVHPTLVTANIRGEDILQSQVGGQLVLLEESSAGHHVDIRPVSRLAHFLVTTVKTEMPRVENLAQFRLFSYIFISSRCEMFVQKLFYEK